MNEANFIVTPGIIPAGFCPQTEQARLNEYASLLTVQASGDFFSFGSSQPAVDDQDKPWIKTDANGALVGLYTFAGGAWVRPHEIPAGPDGMRVLWMGTTTELETYDGGSAGAVTATTGPFWEVDTAFADKIPRGASATVPVATNDAQLSSGASASDEVRGSYFIRRTSRTLRTA